MVEFNNISLLLALFASLLLLGLAQPNTPSCFTPGIHANNITIDFPIFDSGHGINTDTTAYEVSYRSVFDTEWQVATDTLGSSGNNAVEMQVISVRVDFGETLTSGTFILGLQRSQELAEDFEHTAKTPRIAFDASAEDVKAALDTLGNIGVKEVRRCDEFAAPFKPGETVAAPGDLVGSGSLVDGWAYGCPYGEQGGYRWLVVFDTPAFMDVPRLFQYNEELPARWTGAGQQVTITHIKRGMIHPSLCYLKEHCYYTVTGLHANTPYVFRTRALTVEFGWSDYSSVSELCLTKEARAPLRPRAPRIRTRDTNAVTFDLLYSALMKHQDVESIETQYRECPSASNSDWVAGPTVVIPRNQYNFDNYNNVGANTDSASVRHGLYVGGDIDPSIPMLSIEHLKPDTQYEVRVKVKNTYGSSPYSLPSQVFRTETEQQYRITPEAPIIKSVSPTSIDVIITANPLQQTTIGTLKYVLQYKPIFETQWRDAQDLVALTTRRTGVEVQEIHTRQDSLQTGCSGYFWLTLQALEDESTYFTQSDPIAFNASPEEFKNALMKIPLFATSNPRIAVHREMNTVSGYKWTVEVEGLGDIPQLTVAKNTMVDPSGNACWTVTSNKFPLLYKTLRNGGDVYQNDTSTPITIPNLIPQTEYLVRTVYAPTKVSAGVAIDTSDIPSDEVTAITTPLGGTAALELYDSMHDASSSTFRLPVTEKLGNYYTEMGVGPVAARQSDFHYVVGSGMGGASQQSGSNGHCVIVTYNALSQQSFHTMTYYYAGAKEQTYHVPDNDPTTGTINQLTLKCWGGGGGGGKISDLVNGTTLMLNSLSKGGGGAFAQMSIPVQPGDSFSISVGGGGSAGQGESGGLGGYGGGSAGGKGMQGGGGGGGGGASYIKRGQELLIVAGGGGGAGSTDYCCGHGGAAGRNGTSPGSDSPWPLSKESVPTSLTRRYQYTSAVCPDSAAGDWCISEWDVLPGSLPVEHQNLVYGMWPNENYTVWSMPGSGGTLSSGGYPGVSGSFVIRTTGIANVYMDNRVAVYKQGNGWQTQASQGLSMVGGHGADGVDGGGGGGGGYFGGGGGGAGIDGAGGGGGSSYVNTGALAYSPKNVPSSRNSRIFGTVSTPTVAYVNESAVTLIWDYDWSYSLWGLPLRFDIEMSEGPTSEDYVLLGMYALDFPMDYADNSNRTVGGLYTVGGLPPLVTNRYRVVPIFSKGRGLPSHDVLVTTLNYAPSFWEPIVPRRAALTSSGRGLANSILQPKHLDKMGVQIHMEDTWDDITRLNDGPTAQLPSFPSGRRGQSMTVIDDHIYMFGGRTDGYQCASVYTDLLNIGNIESGRLIYPCTDYQNEVYEIWTLDLHTYMWQFVNNTMWGSSVHPPAREQHSAIYVGGDLYIFGGKARVFPMEADIVLNDLWKLTIPKALDFTFYYNESSPVPLDIPRAGRVYASVIGTDTTTSYPERSNDGLCIQKVVVTVRVEHECLSQLRLSITGGGPQSGSPNFHQMSTAHEILLLDQPNSNNTGCVSGVHTFTFKDDLATVLTTSPSGRDTYECCGENPYQGTYKPDGKLSEFIGGSMASEWTLIVQDMAPDHLSGSLLDWHIAFTSFPCNPKHSWTNMTNEPNDGPANRFGATSIAYENSLFIFGGRDVNDAPLTDLYRYDISSGLWTSLNPVRFEFILQSTAAFGYNLVLTSWGLIKYGGYHRQPYITGTSYNYVNSGDVYVCDLVTMKWKKLNLDNIPAPPTIASVSFPTNTIPAPGRLPTHKKYEPPMRYLSSMVFIPANSMHWLQSSQPLSYREFYDEHTDSMRANYANKIIDSLFLFGGSNGATGSIDDGSTGGMLGDMWSLRLANWSTPGVRYSQQQYLINQCRWRKSASALSGPRNTHSCLGSTNADCEVRDLLMLAWCSERNQTLS